MILKLIILAALVRLLLATDKPLLCSGIYTGIYFFYAIFFHGIFPALVGAVVVFVLSSIWFWLLNRFEGTAAFWIIAVLGIILGFV